MVQVMSSREARISLLKHSLSLIYHDDQVEYSFSHSFIGRFTRVYSYGYPRNDGNTQVVF